MKNANRPLLASALALSCLLSAGQVQAAGVSAGTLIQNTATASYNSGGSSVSVQSNTVTLKVDELLDVAMASQSGVPVSTGASTVAVPFALTNSGNGPEAFNLAVDPAVAGNQFDATVQSIVVDSNGNGVYDAGIDAVLGAGSPTPLIAADGSLTVFVLVTAPGSAADGQTSQLRLTAEPATGTGVPGTSFAGQGEAGGDAVVGASGGSGTALASLTASSVSVTLTKSAAIVDPFGGSKPLPGAVVTYTLVASVTGSSTATGLRIVDAIPTGTTYRAGTLTLDAAPLTDGVDGDAGTASAAGIDVALGDVAGGNSKTVTFAVSIN